MLPTEAVRLLAYGDEHGRAPFETWFRKLEPIAAAKVAVAVTRLERGGSANVKSLGAGVHELKVDHGPGYRIYFSKDGRAVIILLGGGTKKRQAADIKAAKLRWAAYKARKSREK